MKACKYGHRDRYANGKCRTCHRKVARDSAKRKRATPWPMQRVPSQPIRGQLVLALEWEQHDYMKAAGMRRRYGQRYQLVPRQVERDITAVMNSDTITIALADRWAAFLGLHLDLLYTQDELRLPDEVLV